MLEIRLLEELLLGTVDCTIKGHCYCNHKRCVFVCVCAFACVHVCVHAGVRAC